MDSIHVKDLQVNYREVGEGLPVVFLHGNPADHRSMFAAFEPLFAERAGYKRVYFDLPGMGKTKGVDWIRSMDDMLELVLAVIDTVIPNERFLVVGESFGGYLARGIAHFRAAQLDGMFLFVPSVKPGAQARQIPEKRIIYSDEEFVASLTPRQRELLAEGLTVHSREIVQTLEELYVSAMLMSDQVFLTRLREKYAYSFDLNNPTPRYDFPALILAGRQDTIIGYADQMELHRYFPRGSVVVLDRAAHVIELEQPTLFKALTLEWLDRVEEYLQMKEKV